jgi:hypothetical protein
MIKGRSNPCPSVIYNTFVKKMLAYEKLKDETVSALFHIAH